MSKKALFAGSFDPLTLGHLNIIERAAKLYDKVVVAVVVNPNKNSLFTTAERIDSIKKCCSSLSNVETASFDGLLADYVNDNEFDIVVRGLRNSKDFEYEQEMAQFNSKLYKKAETVFFLTEPEYAYITSSGVKEIASLNGNIEEFVPDYVKKMMEEKK